MLWFIFEIFVIQIFLIVTFQKISMRINYIKKYIKNIIYNIFFFKPVQVVSMKLIMSNV
jgi:hypothetical protein